MSGIYRSFGGGGGGGGRSLGVGGDIELRSFSIVNARNECVFLSH